MGEIVNLRRVKKQRLRQADAKAAEANRAKHAMTRAEKRRLAHEAETRDRRLDQAKLDQTVVPADPEQP